MKSPAEVLTPAPEELPIAREAEMGLLGALIVDNDQFAAVRQVIKSEDLSFVAHRTIFDTITRLLDGGTPIDLVILRDKLAEDQRLDSIGGADYLMSLAQDVPNAVHAPRYAETIAKVAARRRFIATARRAVAAAVRGDLDGEAGALSQALDALQPAAQAKGGAKSLAELREAAIALKSTEWIPSSINGLSEIIGEGFAPGWTVGIAALTGGGKTRTLAAELMGAASRGHPALFLSLELSAPEAAALCLDALEPGVAETLPLLIYDESPALDAVIRVIEKWLEPLDAGKTPVIGVDYGQKIRVSDPNRERQVAIVAEDLQRLARKRGFLLFLGAQLNREAAKTGEPASHHLRESALLEQICDVLLLLTKTGEDRLRVKCGKHRWGISGREVELSADFKRCSFGKMSAAQILEPLALKVREFLANQSNRRARLREISIGIKLGKRHPSAHEIIEAGLATRAYNVADSEAFLP